MRLFRHFFTNIQHPLSEHFEYTYTGSRLQRVWLRRVLNKMNKVFSRDEIPVNDVNLKKDWLQRVPFTVNYFQNFCECNCP